MIEEEAIRHHLFADWDSLVQSILKRQGYPDIIRRDLSKDRSDNEKLEIAEPFEGKN